MTEPRSASATDRTIGQRVRIRRLEIGMSQERLAELLGLTFQQVQKYEKGVNRIAVSRLIDIADALKQPAATFIHGLGKGAPLCSKHAAEVAASMATPEGAKMAGLFARIKSKAVRQKALGVVGVLAEDVS